MEVGTVQRIDIEDKLRSAYLDYAMSVITARALPDVRDGLKPVQRRILYAMSDMGLRHDRPTRKSARIVGEVLGKYHPHGDSAVYEAMVRMAQDFSMRYPLVDGQGNFGSIDGDSAAAMRYTEARLAKIGEELLIDLDKDTVDFVDNFDGSLQEPKVLPAKLPNLLLNGVGGIAVGMATNIPPHNLSEIVDAITHLLDRYEQADEVTVDDLMRFIQGPDFPTGGTILGTEGIRQAYATGKGRVLVQALAHVEDRGGGRTSLIVTELPYQVIKSNLVERIATLVRDERIDGISDLRDESDRTGMRIVIEIKRGVEASDVLAQLLKYTQLKTTFGVNMLSLVDGEPRTLSLKRCLLYYIDHRFVVIKRRTQYELDRALARAHILEGLLKALDHLDEVIATIRRSRTADTAKTNLIRTFKFSDLQAQAILDMQLRRLAALERKKIEDEYKEIMARIDYLRDLLAHDEKVRGLIRQDVLDLKKEYGDARRTHIYDGETGKEMRPEDLIPNEQLLVVLTQKGSIRHLPLSSSRVTRANVPGMLSTESDALYASLVARYQERALFVTNRGRAFCLPVHQLPDGTQQEHGLPLTDLVHLEDGENVCDLLTVPDNAEEQFLALCTRQGKVKRVQAGELANLWRDPMEVIGLADDDLLLRACFVAQGAELILVTAQGKSIRFDADTVRAQGLSATGMRGISLKDDDLVVDMDLAVESGELLVLTAHGFAKRTKLSQYSAQGRGGQGALTMDITKLATSGQIVGARVVSPADDVILTCDNHEMAKVTVADLPTTARASWGRLVTSTRSKAAIQVGDSQANRLIPLRIEGAESEAAPEKEAPEPKKRAPATRRRRTRSPQSSTRTTSTRSRRAKTDATISEPLSEQVEIAAKPAPKSATTRRPSADAEEKDTQNADAPSTASTPNAEEETPSKPTVAKTRRPAARRRATVRKTPRRKSSKES